MSVSYTHLDVYKRQPKDKTPQDTIRNPRTMYGVTKVSGELLSDYYHIRFGVDTRSVRFPGLISYVTPPGGGTTDYAVDIYYSAVKGEKFECPIAADTFMDMMYMPDGLRAAIEIMEANPDKLIHRNSFNIASMSFDPEIIYNNIKKYMPDFHMEYKVCLLYTSRLPSYISSALLPYFEAAGSNEQNVPKQPSCLHGSFPPLLNTNDRKFHRNPLSTNLHPLRSLAP